MKFKSGDSFGRYRIEMLLGAGGMGAVYRAHDTRLERPVAIKVLSPESEIARTIGDLLREARSASALNHPNVCTVYEVGEEANCPFIAMEYVNGKTLDKAIVHGSLSLALAADYAFQIADALAHAHELGVIHGDLKAANILVSPNDRIKIVDFGLARRRKPSEMGASSVTTAVIAGTLYSMAPEQLRGGTPNMQSDVWSLGVLFFEMMAGFPPFAGSTTAELASAILRDPLPAFPEHIPSVLRQVVDRCLAKEPSRRFRNAGEVRAALETGLGTPRITVHEESGSLLNQWSIPLPPAFASTETSSVQLVGREPDLAVLNAAVDRARSGRRQFVFVAGEAGIGKTRLISEFARAMASSEATVLLGRCDAEALIPYQPFVQALDWYIRACPAALLQSQLQAVESASELAELIPAISRRVVSTGPSLESNAEGRRYRLFEAAASFLSAASKVRPIVMIFEDVHWADRPTLLMLRHTLRSSHEGPLLLVATYRETELDRAHPLGELLTELRREPATTILKLRTLNDAEIGRFVAGWLGRDASPALVKLVAGNTEGNPLFMSEVLRHLAETGKLEKVQSGGRLPARDMGLPEGVREVIGRRIARLTEDCKRVLAVAAVVGRDFTFPVLQVVSDLPEDRLLDVLDEAQAARLIEDAPGMIDGYTFTHALIRETLYGELTAARRVRLHRRVAEALEQGMKPGQEPLADLAYHYGQAASRGDVEKAVSFAVRAGEAAAARFAVDEAARFYGMALQALNFLPDDASVRERRIELHVKSGRALASIGQWAPARAQFEAALSLLPPEQRERRAELLVQCAESAFWSLDVPALRRFANEAVEIANAIGRDDLASDAMACIGAADNSDGNVMKAVESDRRAIERAGGVHTFSMARSAISLYHAGFTEEAILRSSQSVEAARAKDDPAFLVYSLSHYGISCASAGRYADALRAFEEARVTGRRYGMLPFLARSIAMSTGMHIALGDLARAEELAMEARDLARQLAFPPPLISAGIDLLFIYTRAGELGRAKSVLDEVGQAVRSAGGWHGWLWGIRLNQALAEISLAGGDWRGAEENANTGISQSRTRHRMKYEALGLITRASARLKVGDMAHAVEDADSAVKIARSLGDPTVLIDALTVRLDADGSDELLAQGRAAVDRVVQAVPNERLRRRFLDSANVLRITR